MQGLFWVWAQPMRGGLSLAEPIPKVILWLRQDNEKLKLHVIVPFWGVPTGPWWIPFKKGQWCGALVRPCFKREQAVEQTIDLPLIYDAMTLMRRHCIYLIENIFVTDWACLIEQRIAITYYHVLRLFARGYDFYVKIAIYELELWNNGECFCLWLQI